MSTGLLPRNASSQMSDFDSITTRNLTVNNVAVIRTLIATNLTFSNVNASTATISGLTTTGSLNVSIAPATTTTINALTRETDGTIKVNPSLVDLTSTQTLTGKTLTDPIINRIFNGGQPIIVPSGISSQFALQSVAPQTTDNLASYANSSPTFGVLKDSGIASSSLVTLTGAQHLSNKSFESPVLVSGTSSSTTTILAGNSGSCGIFYDKGGVGIDTNFLNFDDATISGNKTTLIPGSGGTLLTDISTASVTNKSFVDSSTFIVDASSPTKRLGFDVTGIAGVDTFIMTQSTVSRTFVFPDATGNVLLDSAFANVSNKNLKDTTTFIVDNATITKKVGFAVAGTANKTTTLSFAATNDQTITFPDATGTLPLLNANNNFTNTFNQFRFAVTINGTTTGTTTVFAGGSGNGSLQFSNGTNTQALWADTSANSTIFFPPNSGTLAIGPTSTTNGNLASYTGTAGVLQDSGFAAASLISGTATTASLLNGKEVHQSWATTSNTNFALTTLTVGVTNNTSMTLTSIVNAYVTSGPDANKSLMYRLTSRVINIAGTVTVYGVEYFTSYDTGLATTALTHVASGANVLVKFAGITGDSMAVTGVSVSYL